MIECNTSEGRFSLFGSTTGNKAINEAKKLGVTNIITRRVAPIREISLPPKDLFP